MPKPRPESGSEDDFVVSDVDSQDGPLYTIKGILSESPGEDKKGRETMLYLIEWEDYPLTECKNSLGCVDPATASDSSGRVKMWLTCAGTWEPEANLIESDLLTPWNRLRARMGKKAFQVYMEKNEARFNEALRKAEEEEEEEQNAQALSERGRGQKRNRSATIPEDSDDEDNTQILQLAQTERNSPKAAPSDSQDIYNSLFVDSQDPDPLGPPPALIHSDVAGQPSAVRRAPLDQSTDEDQNSCSSEGSDDSSMGELAKGSKKTTSQKKGSESLNENGREIGRSASSTRSPGEKIKLSPVKPTRRQSNPIFPVLIQKPTLSRTQTTPSQKAASTSGNPQQNARRLSAPAAQAVATMSRKDSNPSRKKAAGSQIVTASLMTGATAESSSAAQQPPILAASSSMRRSGTQMKSAIRLTNEPKTKLRKEWQSDKHFNKLKFRHLADLKSRREGTPDIAALEFVGARPPGLVKPRAPDPDDNPYGRPEAGSRRMRDSDVDEYQGGNSLEENIPLQDWDENKVPLICASWRLSSNCPYGRQACKFMHRDQDENGRDLPIGDINGVVPPKYRRPPLTCIFWLDNPAGCHKSAEKCDYAHSNTGWRPKDTAHKDEVIQIDPNILPCSESSIPSKYAHGHVPLKHVDGYVPPKDRVPPLTCIFWLDLPAGCTKQDAECEYAHRNTGWRIKDRTHRDKVVQIDPNLLPYSERQTEPYLPTKRMDRFVSTSVPTYTAGYVPPKNRNPALTCKYWLDAPFGCRKPDAECEFAHRNTGWFPNDTGTGQAVQIDRNVLPFSERTTKGSSRSQTIGQIDKRKHHPSELTCWFWMHDQCRFKSDTCMYQHYDTGILADPPSVTLNPKTCHFWAQGKCKLTSEKCKFQHYDSSTKNPNFAPVAVRKDLRPDPEAQKSALGSKAVMDVGMADADPLLPIDAAPAILEMSQVASQPTSAVVRSDPSLAPFPEVVNSPPAYSCRDLTKITEQTLKIDFVTLFEHGDDEKGKSMLGRRALLLYHPVSHAEDMEVITRWLLMHSVEVYSPWFEGCWDQFTQHLNTGGSGIVIAHPDFEYFTELPGFGKLLRQQVRIWSLGVQEAIEYDAAVSDSPPTLVHDCIEIFPVGGFVYITDEVFEQKPQLALAIMQAFFANIDRQRLLDGAVSPWQEVHDASVLWRLCVRPELMASLFRQCEEREAELEAGLSDITAVAELYIMLSETNYIEQDSPAQPLSVSSDKFPVMSERRMIAEEEPVGYFKAREQSLEEGNLRMIRYYAGLQSDLRRDYRHFFIVHTDPTADCAKQWKEEIQSIAAVITPEQCVEELSKNELEPGVDLMFDFHERHMVEKKNAKITQIVAAQAMDVESPLVSTSQISLESGEIRPSQ